jgi:uncharacterized protein involved in exopolysaccharide biosynthesis
VSEGARGAASATLVDVLRGARRSWLAIVFLVAAAAVAGHELGARAEPRYAATAQLSIASEDALIGVFGNPLPGAAIGAPEVELLAESAEVRARAVEALGLPLEAVEDVEATVTDDRLAATVALEVTATSAGQAVDATNAVADATVAAHGDRLQAALDASIAALERSAQSRAAEVAALAGQVALAGPAELPALESAHGLALDSEQQIRRRLDQLRVEAEAARSPVAVAVEAVEAERTGPPKPLHVAILAAVLALAVGLAIVYLRVSFAIAGTTGRAEAGPRAGVREVEPTGEGRRPWGHHDTG